MVEAPTYDRTLKILRGAGADIHTVPLDPDGVDVDRLAELLAGGLRPRLVYVIPTYQNPSGACASLERRKALVELAREHDLVLVEDDPYGLLRFEGERAADAARARRRRARHLLLVVHEDGRAGRPHRLPVAARAAGEAAGGAVREHPDRPEHGRRGGRSGPTAPPAASSRTSPARPRACAHAATRWRRRFGRTSRRAPAGRRRAAATSSGSTLPDGVDTTDALPAAVEQGVAYVKGADFFAAEGGRDAVRLAYQRLPRRRIDEGIARLAGVLPSRPRRCLRLPAGR